MTAIDRIIFHHALPDSFFSIPTNQPRPTWTYSDESPELVAAVFGMEAERNEIIIYTDHQSIRLVGVFPNHTNEAVFGFWETTYNEQLNQHAFALLEADARHKGRQVLIGPLNFNTFHDYRLRINGIPTWKKFDREPVNPTYYPELLTRLGFQVRSLFESRLIKNESIPVAYQLKQDLLNELTHLPVELIPLNPDTWLRYEDELIDLIHQVFSANPAYRPISKAQFNLLYNHHFAEKLCPYSSVLFRDKPSGRLVAMSFCLPNYQSLTFAPGEAPNFVRDFPRLEKKVLLVKSVGVHPDFRKKRLMSYLGAYGMLHFQDLYDEVIFCLMRADNFSLHFSNGLPYEAAQYALFEKPLLTR